ncbi:hypothetical protein PG997_005431 [Apiospora hydei]|uniref:Uncharacterized protein n=1 Tax=Apiospora hydei TaxID=1337664 RepID=A0ABR1X4X9_9PEZI
MTTIVPGADGICVAAQMFLDRVAERIGDFSDTLGIDVFPVKQSEGDFLQYTVYICRNYNGPTNWLRFGDGPPTLV